MSDGQDKRTVLSPPPGVDPALYWAGRMYTHTIDLLWSTMAKVAVPLKFLSEAAEAYNREIIRRTEAGAAAVVVTSPASVDPSIPARCVWLNLGDEVLDEEREEVRTRLKDLFGLVWDFDPKHLTVEFVGGDEDDDEDDSDA